MQKQPKVTSAQNTFRIINFTESCLNWLKNKIKGERGSGKKNLVSFLVDREIAQLAGGLSPGFDHHEGLVAVVDDGLRVIDEPNHLVEDTLGGDFGEGLLAVLDKGFEEDKGEVLNPRALEDDPLLDSADEFDATELVGVDEIAEIEI